MREHTDKVIKIPYFYISRKRDLAGKEIERARKESNKLEECYQQGIWKILSDILQDYCPEENYEE